MAPAPLFVLGCPRSGTTLLADLLSPTRFGAPVESHFITKYARLLHAYGPLAEPRGFDRLMADILSERPVRQWRLTIDRDAFRAVHLGRSYADLVDAVCRARSERTGATSWADKTPHYILDVPLLVRLFPQASFVTIVRDGRDVALSLLEKPWGPGNLYACAEYWKACHADTPALARLRADGRLFELRYETLLETPRDVLEPLYAFLQEPLPEAVLQPKLDAIRRDNAVKWRTRLGPRDIRLFERVASSTLARYGYPWTHTETGVTGAEALAYRLHDALHRGAHLVRINTLDAVRIRYFGMQPFAD